MIAYRDATPADAALLADLFARSFTETFGPLYKPEDLAAFLERAGADAWVGELADPALAVRIADDQGEAVGFAKLGPVSLPVTPAGPAAELRQLYILKPLHGLGIAQELMRWTFDRARAQGARELYLSVYVDNHRARRLYERYGFTFVAPYAFMVGAQADEDHIMRLALED